MWGEKVRVLKNLLDRDGELVLPLKGKFTHRNFADFVAVTEALAASRPQCFVVEMSELAFIDSGGIGMLLMALDVAPITIGADCQIGPNVQLLTPIHPLEPEPRRAKWERAAPITLGDNVWLGGGAIVLPGVTIGEDSVVGAGAVVSRDLPAGIVAVGNPARVIRTL